MDEKTREDCRKHFATHKATLIQDTERYFAMDWRRSDGSVDYYVNYILDKKRGSLIISGDLGDCIATWYNNVSAENMRSHINSIDYFMSKFQCTSDDYIYDEDDIVADIRKIITERSYDTSYCCERNCLDESELWEEIKHEVCNSIRSRRLFVPTERLTEIIGEIDDDYLEWLGDCGKEISMRVYLWVVGFQMACDQLGIGKEKQ